MLRSDWGLDEVGDKPRHDFDSATTWPQLRTANKMAPCILSSPKSRLHTSPKIETSGHVGRRDKTYDKGKKRATPSTSRRWAAMHRREEIIERMRSIRSYRLQAKASQDLEEFMRDLRLPFLAPSFMNGDTQRYGETTHLVRVSLIHAYWSLLSKLRWSPYESDTEPAVCQQPARYMNSHGVSSALANGYFAPYDHGLNHEVVMFVSHINSSLSKDYLQVPSSWPVSRN
jgi:hypothetical protein